MTEFEVADAGDFRVLEVRLPSGRLALVKVYPDEPRYDKAQLNADNTRRTDAFGAPMAPPPVIVQDDVKDTKNR